MGPLRSLFTGHSSSKVGAVYDKKSIEKERCAMGVLSPVRLFVGCSHPGHACSLYMHHDISVSQLQWDRWAGSCL